MVKTVDESNNFFLRAMNEVKYKPQYRIREKVGSYLRYIEDVGTWTGKIVSSSKQKSQIFAGSVDYDSYILMQPKGTMKSGEKIKRVASI